MNTADLFKQRPRNRFLLFSALAFLLLVTLSWCTGEFDLRDFTSERSTRNLKRFLTQDIIPKPIRTGEAGWEVLPSWALGVLAKDGWQAMGNTLWISITAILFAAIGAACLIPGAARNIATTSPFVSRTQSGAGWRIIIWVCRGLLVFCRSIPEFIWAFLLVGILGINAWPAVLALALHNIGILGRLGAETVENLPPGIPRALRISGGSRRQILLCGVFPLVLTRMLVYFFYRWETCVREATVIGLLGVSSLGFYIVDARARFKYDELLLYILLGSALVLMGDFVSAVVRKRLRDAGGRSC
jgi:phosphonate transport system permease protein